MPAAVLFDVDGTLVDTNYQHVIAWSDAFRLHGYDDVDAVRLHRALDMGSDRFIEHILGHDDDRVRTAHSSFYRPNLERLRPFRGAQELLNACAGRGLRVVVATSAAKDEADRLQAALDADDAVAAWVCKADVDTSKPAPDIVEVALDRAGVDPAHALLVGDTVWDIEAAARAGLDCVAVLSGGIGADELRDAGAVAIYRDAAHLLEELADSPIAKLDA